MCTKEIQRFAQLCADTKYILIYNRNRSTPFLYVPILLYNMYNLYILRSISELDIYLYAYCILYKRLLNVVSKRKQCIRHMHGYGIMCILN